MIKKILTSIAGRILLTEPSKKARLGNVADAENEDEVPNLGQVKSLLGSNVSDITGQLNITADTTSEAEPTALIINSPTDTDFRQAIRIKAGTAANQRRYFEFQNHLGVRTNLLGFNAVNGFIAYNSVSAYHYFGSSDLSDTIVNSGGTAPVRINRDETPTGTGGLLVYDGTANGTSSNLYGAINAAGIIAYKGLPVQANNSAATHNTRLLTTAASNLIGTLTLVLTSSQNQINLANSTFVSKFYFNTNNVNFGFGGESYGGGAGVMYMKNATTVPTTNPTDGIIIYPEGGVLKYRDSTGTIKTISTT